MRPLKIALSDRRIVKALKDDRVNIPDITLNHVHVNPIILAMRRMVRNLEFDICEMALSTYLCARAYGKSLTAIPVFISRNFQHGAIFRNINSGIKEPKDLEGRIVGVNRGYTVTTGLLARGILQTEYGVDLKTITWAPTGDEHVEEFRAPTNVNYTYRGNSIVDLLRTGELAAAVGDIRSEAPEIASLIPNPERASFEYFRRTGIFPINHCVVIETSILKKEPWIAKELFVAFKAAKEDYLAYLDKGDSLTTADQTVVNLRNCIGNDPFTFGIEPNRAALETLVRFAVDQQVIPNIIDMSDLFAANTLDLT